MIEGSTLSVPALSTARQPHRPPRSPVGAIEYLAEMLATSEQDGRGDDFYGRLSEATTRVTSLRRAVIFRYDHTSRHVRLAGAHGVDLAIPGFDALAAGWPARAPLGWDCDDPAPVAAAACFLLSPLARAITGEILHVDGGHHAIGAAAGEIAASEIRRGRGSL